MKPNHTAERTALWRALHNQIDPPPHIIEDTFGLELLAPTPDWRNRPDMDPEGTKRVRASIVARARFIEDLAIESLTHGISQYVILGAGLDTFAVRHTNTAVKGQLFEIDEPETLAWKETRLKELGYNIPQWLRFVPVDFEAGGSWWQHLLSAGFHCDKPAFVSCTGVTLYLTKEAILTTLQQIAAFAPGSKLAMTFILPANLQDPEDQPLQKASAKGAQAGGTPFISFFSPDEMLALARQAGFKKTAIVSGHDLAARYFTNRTDDFRPSNSEQFLLAET